MFIHCSNAVLAALGWFPLWLEITFLWMINLGELSADARYHDILLSPEITLDEVGYLKVLIKEHHSCFCQLYPSASVIPKMHYLVHTPRLITKYAPTLLSLYEVHTDFCCYTGLDNSSETGRWGMKQSIHISKHSPKKFQEYQLDPWEAASIPSVLQREPSFS